MKNTLLIAAVAMMATPAMASKSRVSALQNAAHISDVQYIFDQRVTDLHNVGELATIEFGQSGTNTPRAEGGIVRKSGNGVWGLYLGKRAASFGSSIDKVNNAINNNTVVGLQKEQNPLAFFYGADAGSMKWAAGLTYSSSNFKGKTLKATDGTTDLTNAKSKVETMGVLAGVEADMWDASLILGLGGKSSSENQAGSQILELKSNSRIGLRGGYKMDSMYIYGAYDMSGGKVTLNAADAADLEKNDITVGVLNSHKKDATEVFYGVAYKMSTDKDKVADSKTESTMLPVIVGLETEANSWLTLRGSVTQNAILGSEKTTTAGVGEANTVADNTTVAAGASMKWGKVVLDASLAAATSGNIDTSAGGFLTNASLTYNF